MVITLSEAVREAEFCLNSGGINSRNYEYFKGIIKHFGADTHEIFQEVEEQLRALVEAGIVAEETA